MGLFHLKVKEEVSLSTEQRIFSVEISTAKRSFYHDEGMQNVKKINVEHVLSLA